MHFCFIQQTAVVPTVCLKPASQAHCKRPLRPESLALAMCGGNDVVGLLHGLGLGQYAAPLMAKGWDSLMVLSSLKPQDLVEFGMKPQQVWVSRGLDGCVWGGGGLGMAVCGVRMRRVRRVVALRALPWHPHTTPSL